MSISPRLSSPDALAQLEQLLVRRLLSPAAQAQYEQGKIGDKELERYARAVEMLSTHYVGCNAPKLDSLGAHAYALYYTPINFIKVRHLLSQLPPSTEETTPLRVLDYGCGPGTAALACASFLHAPLEVTGVDGSASMLKTAEMLLADRPFGAKLTFRGLSDSTPLSSGRFHVAIAANVLNELTDEDARELLRKLLEVLDEKGILLLLEPALSEPTRRAMAHRDFLLECFPNLAVLFPCTHALHCPMLASSRDDWCHGELSWEEPPLTRQFDRLLGFNKHRLKYSGFVFQKGGTMRGGYRIIREARKTKRGTLIGVCGEDAYGETLIRKPQDTREIRSLRLYDYLPELPPVAASHADKP